MSRFKTAHSTNPQSADLILQIPQVADLAVPQILQVTDLADSHTGNLQICGIDEIKGLYLKFRISLHKNNKGLDFTHGICRIKSAGCRFADLIPQILQVADLADPHTHNLRISGIDEIKGLLSKIPN